MTGSAAHTSLSGRTTAAVADTGVPKGTAAMVFNQDNASAAALIDVSTRVTAVRVERP